MYGRHRRALGVLAVLATMGAVAVLNAGVGSAAVQPSRQHITLEKLCPKDDANVRLLLQNVTDQPALSNDGATPETITVEVVAGGVPQTFDVVQPPGPSSATSVVLAPGQSIVVEVTGPSPVQWARIYQARFTATYRGEQRLLLSKQYCRCQGEPPPATTTSTPGGGT